ncbi:MAG: hypothetical protein GF392_00050, partial [Candidatus Omnitrophica bacterium]|nr:hypothetical protein [Candidatus Omnitrophota bacterium]
MKKRNHIILKIISICVAATFMHQQIVWAAGDMLLPASEQPGRRYETLFENTSPGQRARGLGTVEAVHTQGDSSVINIQDCHSSLSAQYSIVDILSRLVSQYDLDLVAIEGGTGYIDTAALKSLPDEAVKKRTADFLMRNGRISAGEFFAATSNKDIALYGVEDNELYRKNLESFRHIHEVNGENLELVRELLDDLREKEKDVYNPELYSTVFKTRLHRKGRIGMDVYLEHLLENADREGIDTLELSEIRRFKKSVQLETELDFEKATEQRNELVKRLAGFMDSSSLKEMIRMSLRFKKGKLEQTAYHLWLEEKARENDIGLEAYPELQRFIRYAKSYSCINILKLQNEVRALREKVIGGRTISEEEERLFGTVRTVELLEGLFSVRLSRTEVELLEELLAELPSEQLVAAVEVRTGAECGQLRRMLRMAHQALEFYALTRKRDAAMLSNTIEAMRREKTRVAALISGGHHSRGLTELMKKKQLSYLVFMPEYSADEQRPYVAVLTRKADVYRQGVPGG